MILLKKIGEFEFFKDSDEKITVFIKGEVIGQFASLEDAINNFILTDSFIYE